MGRIRLFVGGHFITENGLQYVGGSTYIVQVSPKDFNYEELVEVIEELGEKEIVKIHYRLHAGARELENSLVIVCDNESCSKMLEHIQQCGRVEVYVEHPVEEEGDNDNADYVIASRGKEAVMEDTHIRPHIDMNVGSSQIPQRPQIPPSPQVVPGEEGRTEGEDSERSSSYPYSEDDGLSIFSDEEFLHLQQTRKWKTGNRHATSSTEGESVGGESGDVLNSKDRANF
ncbi:hypothetical protein J5N97_016382 [Dioscorea zingiberensis]|uniref:PB1-like domain-containing protein n=1 Tax=Dioscorea zingiberensis TaxID=325984 RepID=A0A9D5HFL8_9LILI|nr:hypothetical protein J5N97_016382 [Dioscorea zingiberensis]